jgi:ribosomal protein S18 acetylase RimI-like enzyme
VSTPPAPTIRIRELADADAPAILALARTLQARELSLYERMKPPEAIGDWYVDAIVQDCREKKGAVLVAEDATGTVVGYASVFVDVPTSIAESDYEYACIGDLVVAPEARGQGVGRALVNECERRARAAGVGELRLDVLARNTQARAVYATLGFEDHEITVRKKI